MQEHLNGIGVTWQFNVEHVPWWGGVFEWMVRSTKRCLKKLIGRSHNSLDELTMALAEIEAIFNSRSLSYMTGEDQDEPITPSHLMVGQRTLSLPDHLHYTCNPNDEEFKPDANQMSARVRHLSNLPNHFWRRWRTEYLNCLQAVQSHLPKKTQGDRSLITVGDVLVVKEEHLPRGHCKLGVIQQVLTGCDGFTRAAMVKVAASDRQHSTLRRPVQLLYPLEIHSNVPYSSPYEDTSDPDLEELSPGSQRSDDLVTLAGPKRDVVRRAAEVTRDWITEQERKDSLGTYCVICSLICSYSAIPPC